MQLQKHTTFLVTHEEEYYICDATCVLWADVIEAAMQI